MTPAGEVAVFVAGTAVIVAVPGPNILYLVTRSLHQGRAAGVVSVLGIEVATLVHACAATLGLTSLLRTSALLFSAIKILGAAYLVVLGIRKLVARDGEAVAAATPERELSRIFAEAFVVNLLNPKTALFFLAFLPQFVAPRGPSAPSQIMSFALLLVGIAMTIELAYVLLASSLRGLLSRDARAAARSRQLAGGAYILLGLATALARRGDP